VFTADGTIRLVLGDEVVMEVRRSGDKIVIVTDAPPNVPVDREEVFFAKQVEKAIREAAMADSPGPPYTPSAPACLKAIRDELVDRGGEMLELHRSGDDLFARVMVPLHDEELQRDDLVQGGVAVAVRDAEIRVFPYLLRRICGNGQIFSQSLEGVRLRRLPATARDREAIADLDRRLRAALLRCVSPVAFRQSASQMKRTLNTAIPLALTDLVAPGPRCRQPLHLRVEAGAVQWRVRLETVLRGQRPHVEEALRESIRRQFDLEGEPSLLGLMSAVAATARDLADPELRWRLEQLAGELPALPTIQRGSPRAKSVAASAAPSKPAAVAVPAI
jgi:hypothetical protein